MIVLFSVVVTGLERLGETDEPRFSLADSDLGVERLVVRYRPSLAVSLVVAACIYRSGSKATATGQIADTTFPKCPWEVHRRFVTRSVLEFNIQATGLSCGKE